LCNYFFHSNQQVDLPKQSHLPSHQVSAKSAAQLQDLNRSDIGFVASFADLPVF